MVYVSIIIFKLILKIYYKSKYAQCVTFCVTLTYVLMTHDKQSKYRNFLLNFAYSIN